MRWLLVAFGLVGCASAASPQGEQPDAAPGSSIDAASPGGADASADAKVDPPAPVLAEYVFQDGVSPTADYAGTRDVAIFAKKPRSAEGKNTSLFLDGEDEDLDEDTHLLVRWDTSVIPTRGRVKSAKVVLELTDGWFGLAKCDYFPFEMRAPWDEEKATWETSGIAAWEAIGASGAKDRATTLFAMMNGPRAGTQTLELNASGVILVQRWIEEPSTNYGLIFEGDESRDGLEIVSRENSDKAHRPKLILTMVPEP